jgi:hypothetical protein
MNEGSDVNVMNSICEKVSAEPVVQRYYLSRAIRLEGAPKCGFRFSNPSYVHTLLNRLVSTFIRNDGICSITHAQHPPKTIDSIREKSNKAGIA